MTTESPSLEEELKFVQDKLRYHDNCVDFIREVLGLVVEPFHEEWIGLFENNEYVSLLAPRSHGKTWLVGAYLVWRIIKNPNIRILTVTINQQRANEMMSFVQPRLAFNDKLIELFGDQKVKNIEWSRSTLRVKGADRGLKEPTLTVFGLTAGMVGGHYDVIVLDDITDRESSRLEKRRKELEIWYNQTVTPMLEPDGQIIEIGTKWHETDIHYYLQNLPNYESSIYKAIIDEEKKEVLWPESKHKGKTVGWSYDRLMEKKAGMGGSLAFQMQYQNEFISTEDSPIRRDWVEASMENYGRAYKKVLDNGIDLQMFIGVDLASKGEESDYFAITVVGIHKGYVFVVDGYRGKKSLFQQFDLIRAYDTKWQPVRIGVEQVGPQKIIVDQLRESSTLPVVPITSSVASNKMSRVMRMSMLFETKCIFLNPDLGEWADELIYFPRAKHDDLPDSLSFAIQASQLGEEEKKLDWDYIASTISAKKVENVKHVGGNRFSFSKV